MFGSTTQSTWSSPLLDVIDHRDGKQDMEDEIDESLSIPRIGEIGAHIRFRTRACDVVSDCKRTKLRI